MNTPAHLLLVDDNEQNLGILANRLRAGGYQISQTTKSQTALEWILSKPFDLVLLDLIMPGLTSVQLVEQVRKKFSRLQLPIVMVAGVSEARNVAEALQRGANDYVTKPYDFQVIQTRVEMQIALKANRLELERVKSTAEASASGKAEFLAKMSHELRTPLNAMIGGASLLLSTSLSEEQAQYADMVKRAGHELLTLVNDTLDYSTIAAHKLVLESVDFNLLALAEEAIDLVANTCASRDVELTLQLDPGIPIDVHGDPGRLRQVLTTLLLQSARFTEQGQMQLRLRPEGGFVHVEVVDTGIDIPPNAPVFDPFAAQTYARQPGGNGLALAICRHLVQLMGGRIGFQSAPGQGCCFWFEVALEARSERRWTQLGKRLRDEHVLVVENHPSASQVLVDFLKAWGMRVDAVEWTPTLASEIKDRKYDLALIDVIGDQMKGLELGQELRKRHSKWASVPLCLLYSHSPKRRGLINMARDAGFAECLAKPMKPEPLMHALERLLGLAGAKAAAQPVRRRREDLRKATKHLVLVVEDHSANQALLARMLDKLGYVADVASNGKEAVAAAARGGYALVLMDLNMPGMDGCEASTAIRHLDEAKARVPIVALTAIAVTDELERARAAGIDDHLCKPITVESLEAKLREWVGRGSELVAKKSEARASASLDGSALQLMRDLTSRGEPDLLNEIIEEFVANAPSLLQKITTLAQGHDSGGVKRSARLLHAKAQNVGAHALATLLKKLEKRASDDKLEDAPALLRAIKEEFGRVRAELLAEWKTAA